MHNELEVSATLKTLEQDRPKFSFYFFHGCSLLTIHYLSRNK